VSGPVAVLIDPTAPDGAPAVDAQSVAGPSIGDRLTNHRWWGIVWFAIGAALGARPLRDNSFLTHLATGRLILDHGPVHADPYTFTVHGTPWVVQSWGASIIYASAERALGDWAIRGVVALVTGLLLATVWRLTRPAGGLLSRIALMAMVGGAQFAAWSARPQIFAFALLAAAMLVLVERYSAWWLVAIFGVWINLHGSFPVGIVAVGLTSLALVIERQERWTRIVTTGLAAVGGSVFGALVSPYGVDILTFPVKLLGRSDVLQYIVEWRRPSIGDVTTWFAIVLAAAAVWSIVRRRAWGWLPLVVVFSAMGAWSTRNLVLAAIVAVPAVAPGLDGLGTFPPVPSLPWRRALVGGAAVMAVVLVGIGLTDDWDLTQYPVAAVTWAQAHHLVANPDVRVVTHDYVGNYLELRYGARAYAFVDDRAEVFDLQNTKDYVSLLVPYERLGDWEGVLDRYRADVVIWSGTSPGLIHALARSSEWHIGYRDTDWIVACRVSADLDC
jgi:hypothetical protein